MASAEGMVEHSMLVAAVASRVDEHSMLVAAASSRVDKITDVSHCLQKLEDSDGAGTEIDPILNQVTFSGETNWNSLLEGLEIRGYHSCMLDLDVMEPNEREQWTKWFYEDSYASYLELAGLLGDGSVDEQPGGTAYGALVAGLPPPPPPHGVHTNTHPRTHPCAPDPPPHLPPCRAEANWLRKRLLNARGTPHLPRTEVGAKSVMAAMTAGSVGITFAGAHFSTIHKSTDGESTYTLMTVRWRGQ